MTGKVLIKEAERQWEGGNLKYERTEQSNFRKAGPRCGTAHQLTVKPISGVRFGSTIYKVS